MADKKKEVQGYTGCGTRWDMVVAELASPITVKREVGFDQVSVVAVDEGGFYVTQRANVDNGLMDSYRVGKLRQDFEANNLQEVVTPYELERMDEAFKPAPEPAALPEEEPAVV